MTRPGTVRRSRDRGAAAVEFALILPLLLLVLFAIIDFGRMFNAQITITEAAREGARAVAYGQPAGPRVSAATNGLTGVTTTTTACPNANGYAEVKLGYSFEFVTPFAVLAEMFGSSPSGTVALQGSGVMTCSG